MWKQKKQREQWQNEAKAKSEKEIELLGRACGAAGISEKEPFIDMVRKEAEKDNKFIVYITSKVSADGNSWSDLQNQSVSAVDIGILKKLSLTMRVFRGIVETKQDWEDINHAWKADSLIKAGGIPSIALYKGKECLARADNEKDF